MNNCKIQRGLKKYSEFITTYDNIVMKQIQCITQLYFPYIFHKQSKQKSNPLAAYLQL